MIKRIGVYTLPQGADGDAFWKYHKEVHSVQAKEAFKPYLKRYVINRVRDVIAGSGSWYGIVETWWDNLEDLDKGFAALNATMLPSGLSVSDDFTSRTATFTSAEVEEFVAMDRLEEPGVKRMTFYSLADGVDGDDFFEYHTKRHSRDVVEAVKAEYNRRKYVIHRATEFIKGEDRFYGFIQTWWRSHADMDRDLSELGQIRLPSGQLVVEEFFEQVRDVVVYEVEEYVVLG